MKIVLPFLLLLSLSLFGQENPSGTKLPADITITPQPFYHSRPDGQPGRELTLHFKDARLTGAAQIAVKVNGKTEVTQLPAVAEGRTNAQILLPPDAGVRLPAQVTLTLRQGKQSWTKSITVPALRHWTVYLYSHSHVDIGYTNTQANVEILHKRNIDEGIKLGEETKAYPEGSRSHWNPEVTWPLERYWQSATPARKEQIVQAVQKGYLCLDASYLNLNTSSCSDEELFQIFRFSRGMQQLTGVPIQTFQQMDIPGMSWGLVPVMVQQGVKYIMSWPNSCRAGNGRSIDGKPFWWVGPDGKSRVLFFQPGGYANGGSMTKGGATGRPWFGQRDPDKVPAVIRTGSANVDFTKALTQHERPENPFSFHVISWSLWDNCPMDADIPLAVKNWNETHAFPHIIIAGGTEIMQMIEKNYGDQLPVVKGDFTEYWTDGLGTAAGLTAINRNAKERLVQAETLWTMLHPGKPAPRDAFDEAWRYIAMGSEHTWCAENPTEPFFQDAIWKVKQSYFREAGDRTQTLLEESLAPATDKSNGALGPNEGPSKGGVVLFNTQSWRHGGVVTLTKAESSLGDRVIDDKEQEVPAQRLSTGELLFLATDVPAFGSRHYRVMAGKSAFTEGCSLTGTTLSNRKLTLTVDPVTGNITQLVDKATGKNFVNTQPDGGLNTFRWMPGDSDNARADSAISLTTVEAGPVVVELRVSSKAPGCRGVSRSVRLVLDQPYVEISNTVDKLPLVAKDGIHFGFAFDLPKATTRMDIPWGVVRVEEDLIPAANRNWLTLQRWADISNEKEGVTWCSLDAPLIESGSMTANQSGTWSGERKPWLRKLEQGSAIYSWVMNNHWFTNFPLTQEGPVTFRYRIRPHGAFEVAAANRFGLEQSQPLVPLAADNNAIARPLIAVEGSPAITVSILKPSADGHSAITRLRSVSGKEETVQLSWPAGKPKSVNICQTEEVAGQPAGESVVVPANGFVTLKITWY